MAKKNQAIKVPKLKFTVNHALVTLYTILMFTLFPLFLTNYYQSARRDKFWLFVIVTGAVGVSVGIIVLCQRFSKATSQTAIYKDPFKLNLTDIGILGFLGVTLISTIGAVIAAEDPGAAFSSLFLGSYGRNMGLLTILMFAVAYFCVSRFFYYNKYVIYCMFIGMTVMSFIAIVNFYYIDILGIFAKYSNVNVIQNFTSTIGNKNYLSAMITVALPFSVGLAVATKDKTIRLIAYISTGLQFMGLLVATSDGGFLGSFAAFAIMLVILSKDMQKLSKFFFCLAIMMASAKLLWLFDLIMKGNNKGYTSFSEIFVYNNYVFILIGFFLGLAILAGITKSENAGKYAFITTFALVALGFVAIIAMFIYYSVINTETPVGSFTRFFRFNAAWGTHRGFFWIRSFDVIRDFNLWQVIFGSGPDTYYNVFKPYFAELSKYYGDTSTNAAHNVYINYLVTVGVAGILSYLLFVGSAMVNSIKKAFSNPLALMCVGVIVAYAAQDIVNIANPVNTPWFIMFIALSESTRMKANSTERLDEVGF